MIHPPPKRQCKHCKTVFVPDPRCAKRQRYCCNPECRKASKAASQHRWLHKPANRDDFQGPTHIERVRAWRQAHPGYWRRQASRTPHALQEDLAPQPSQKQALDATLRHSALQDDFFLQPAVFVGLLAHLTGLALQEDIAMAARQLQQLGHDILFGAPSHHGGLSDAQTPPLAHPTAPRAQPVQLGGSAPGP